jgi:hypothetical protein
MADEETQETVAAALSPQAPSSAGSSRSEQSEHVTKHARTNERSSFASRLEASATAADEAEEANRATIERIVKNPHREGAAEDFQQLQGLASLADAAVEIPPALQSSIDELAGMQAHAIVAKIKWPSGCAECIHGARGWPMPYCRHRTLCKGCSELLSQQVTQVGGDPSAVGGPGWQLSQSSCPECIARRA